MRAFDVVVCGAGVVGLTLARLLESSLLTRELRVALVAEPAAARGASAAQVPAWRAAISDPLAARTLAVNESTARTMTRLGIDVRTVGVPIDEMVIWDHHGRGTLRFDAGALGLHELATTVFSDDLQAELSRGFRGGVERITDKVVDVRVTPEAAHLKLADGSTVSGRLLVGCDGAASRVRSATTVSRWTYQYGSRGVVMNVTGASASAGSGGGSSDEAIDGRVQLSADETAVEHSAFQVFTSSGPLALLPYGGGRYNIIWSSSEYESITRLPPSDLVNRINTELGGPGAPSRVPTVSALLSKPVGFPLVESVASSFVAPRIALPGAFDAAHTVHPLAGQGANLGIMDAVSITRCIQDAVFSGQDLGDVTMLGAYNREARTRAQLMVSACHAIHAVYSVPSPVAGALRGLGMNLITAAPAAARAFQMVASGSMLPQSQLRTSLNE